MNVCLFGSLDCSGSYGHAAISPALYSRDTVSQETQTASLLLLIYLLQIVVSYKSFCRYKTRLIDGLNCHIVSQATSLLEKGETLQQWRNVGGGAGGGAADTSDRDLSRQHQL